MSQERFQSETGQTIDDNGCLFFGNTSPLFYTVNPRSGISLRQQEQLGAPSILKSFRDLPGCTRLSSSLSNLDSTSGIGKRAQFPLLPDIHQKSNNMGKSLQGHSGKRFVRERYNPPFKVNAKIRHVYTQEVTTIEGRDQQQTQAQPRHHPHAATCHRQTQTEVPLSPESKLLQEVEQITDEDNESRKLIEEEKVAETNFPLLKLDSKDEEQTDKGKVDAATSPIPSPYYPTSSTDAISPFTGCSQMSVYPPLNYVRKLEDLEKITGHIVIQRFFTRTDDAFGTWLEKQLGMTSKSVSVDTSEFENAKTAEAHDDDEEHNGVGNITNDEILGIASELESRKELSEENSNEGSNFVGAKDSPEGDGIKEKEDGGQSGEGVVEESPTADNADCALADPIKCECYLDEVEKEITDTEIPEQLVEIEKQIIPIESAALGNQPGDTVADVANGSTEQDEVETLVSASLNTEESRPPNSKKLEKEEDIDEMVRCTLEAYLMAPMAYEELNDEKKDPEKCETPPVSAIKSEIDSGRADSIRSQDKVGSEGHEEIEGNTSHDSVETVYEIPMSPPKNIEFITDETKLENESVRILQRSLSADSCIGTESSGDAKNPATNASQSSNDTIEGLDPALAPKELADLSLGSPASAPPTITTKLPSISATLSAAALARKLSSGKSQRSITPCSVNGTGRINTSRIKEKTENAESEDADGESETESENTDHFLLAAKLGKQDGTDLELEEVEEYEGDDDDDRDAFDTMVANHLKYSRGLPTATTRRSRLNRGTQTTKSIEPSTTSGSISPCSSSNSSFDVEIISKSKRITTTSSSGGGGAGVNNPDSAELITPSNMTLAWHEGGRRRSYLPSSSSSLNLLNMKFSLGKDFESEVSIRMPTNKSSTTTNMSSASMLLPGSGGTGGKTLMSSTSRSHHHHYYPNRGLSPSSHHSQQQISSQQPLHTPNNFASAMQSTLEPTELQSLWKDVRTKLDVQVDEISATIPEEESPVAEGLEVRGSGILPGDLVTPGSGSTTVKLRRNEERIKRSLQRLKKILDD